MLRIPIRGYELEAEGLVTRLENVTNPYKGLWVKTLLYVSKLQVRYESL